MLLHLQKEQERGRFELPSSILSNDQLAAGLTSIPHEDWRINRHYANAPQMKLIVKRTKYNSKAIPDKGKKKNAPKCILL